MHSPLNFDHHGFLERKNLFSKFAAGNTRHFLKTSNDRKWPLRVPGRPKFNFLNLNILNSNALKNSVAKQSISQRRTAKTDTQYVYHILMYKIFSISE